MRTLFKSLVLVLLASSAFSQKSYAPKTYFGVRAGVNGSNMTRFVLFDNIIPEFKYLPAPTGALFVEFEIGENFSIQPELMFSQKGFQLRESINLGEEFLGVNLPVSGRLSFRTNYLEVPILAKIKMGDPKAAHGYLVIGPNIGYLADADVVVRVLQILPLRGDVPTDFFKPFEFSGVGGLGYEIPLGKGGSKFFMEGRYQHGFTRVLDTPIIQLPVRNRTFGASVGVIIRLTPKK